MTIAEKIDQALSMEKDDWQPSRLKENLIRILEEDREIVRELCRQLNGLIGNEAALTIPLTYECTVKVKFSGPVTKQILDAFSRSIKNIAKNYVSSPAKFQGGA